MFGPISHMLIYIWPIDLFQLTFNGMTWNQKETEF